MDRRDFVKTSTLGGAFALGGTFSFAQASDFQTFQPPRDTWYERPMRWAQLVLVENDPGSFDPDFWLDYFKRTHSDAVCLSAGGVVAYYPTDVPFHHRSLWLEGSDPFAYLVDGCRKMNMSIIGRSDPHACWEDVYRAHPDWIQTEANGKLRKHWSNPELWVTCALGPYNFEFMDQVHQEVMERYQLDGIFSNRWAGHGICYCKHCQDNFKEYSGLDLPRSNADPGGQTTTRFYLKDPTYLKWSEWRIVRLRELWNLWDGTMRAVKLESRFIPNGFPDRIVTGELSDIFFTDHQARRGLVAPYDNGRRAKELRATMGMKPLGGIFSIGTEEEYRWKDSVQNGAEIKIWVSECLANNMRPWWVKFGGINYDQRWLPVVEEIYQFAFENETYLRNTNPIANVAMVYSEQTSRRYGGEAWQQNPEQHADGMYHALIEARIPFEMVNDQLLDAEHLEPFQLLILPNIAALSDEQCAQLKAFADGGGSILATFETSLYNEEGARRTDFGLSELFGVSSTGKVEGPMKNSYLRLKQDSDGSFHPILRGLEDAYRIINGIHRVEVKANTSFPSPVTLIPTYPDLPMEHVYPREPETTTRELYLREHGSSRIAYIPWDIDRSFWKILTVDHGKLLGNVIRWTLNERPVVEVEGVGVLDVTAWAQENSMTVHLVNLTNPMMLKGPFRELIPVGMQKVSVKLPASATIKSVKLLKAETSAPYKIAHGRLETEVPSILDHEIIAIDFG